MTRSTGTARLYTMEEAAERMNTSHRFVRRLIAERRIAFTRLGRHIRIAEADIEAFIAAGWVEPRLRRARSGGSR